MTSNNDKKVLNVPALRFPEFSGEWIHKTIDEIFELRNGYTPSKANQSFWNNGTIPWFRMEDIRLNGGILYDAIQHITPEAVKGSGLFEPYSIILATTATIGEHAMIIADSLANQQFTNFKVRKSLSLRYAPYYLYYYFFRIDKWCLKNTNAGGLLSVDIPSLKRKPIYAPLIDEQIKIAKLLRLIDERIATQNKIIEDLNKLKSAISECIFNSIKGDVVMLSEICDIVKGKQINGEYLSESGEYYVMNGGTEPSGYYSEYNVKANTISISEGGNSCGYVQFNNFPFWSGGHCYSLQNIADIVDNLYLYHYLKSKEEAIMKLRIGSGLPNIQKKDLAMFKTIVPPFEQQITISTFLSSLERKAEIEERILNVMQKQKLYLLQQMFI